MRRGAGRGRLRDRARRQPQALPRRRGARGPQARPHAGRAAWSCSPSSPSACRCTGWPSPAARRAPGRALRQGVRRPRRATSLPSTAAQLRRLPRRQTAPAASAAYTLTDPSNRRLRGVGQLVRRRRSTPCCSASPRRGARTSSTTAGRSRRCRRGASLGGGPLNDQQIADLDRLPAQHPDLAGQARRDPSCCSRPSIANRRCCRARTDRPIAAALVRHRRATCTAKTLRRGAVQPGPVRRLRQRRLLAARRCHTQGWSLRRARSTSGGGGAPRLRTSPTARELRPVRHRRRPGRRSSCSGPQLGQAATVTAAGQRPDAGLGHRPATAAIPTDATMSPAQVDATRRIRSRPSSTTSGACDDVDRPPSSPASTWNPEHPRHPRRHRRRRRSCAARSTCSSPPTSGSGSASSSRWPASSAGCTHHEP